MESKCSVTESPREVGLWLQGIMLANPGVLFSIMRVDDEIILVAK